MTTTLTAATSAPTAPWTRLARARFAMEVRQLFRDRQQVTFTFAFPMLMMIIFGSVFSGNVAAGVSFRQYFLAGMIASGVVYSAFQNLAIVVPLERDDGTLKRLRGTPTPRSVYFAGKLGVVVVVYVAQVTLLLLLAHVMFHVPIPTEPARWVTFAWVSVLGLSSCTLLGLAFSTLPRSAKSAPAVVTPIVLILQFTSGVYFNFSTLPTWMQKFASIFPLKWLTQGMRSVFLPPRMALHEPSGSWQHPATAIVLLIWTVIAAVWAVRSFRWQRRGED